MHRSNVERFRWFTGRRSLLTTAFVFSLAVGQGFGDAAVARLETLDGRLVDPIAAAAHTKAVVVLFLSVDCPISNRYAPEIGRLHERFRSSGVEFSLVYPNKFDSPRAIRAHVAAYGLRGRVLRDPAHVLVGHTKTTVTPEAVVFDAARRMVYRGRIDNRFVSIAVQRPQPTQRDLEDAILLTLAGKTVRTAVTSAVGCYVADFR